MAGIGVKPTDLKYGRTDGFSVAARLPIDQVPKDAPARKHPDHQALLHTRTSIMVRTIVSELEGLLVIGRIIYLVVPFDYSRRDRVE